MKTLFAAAVLVAVSSTSAFADSCPQVGNAFSADVLRLANKAAEVDALWDQLADNSEASRRAEDLKDSTREFHGVMFREDCDDLVEEFDDILRDHQQLLGAVAENATIARRVDVRLILQQLQRVIGIVSRDVNTLR